MWSEPARLRGLLARLRNGDLRESLARYSDIALAALVLIIVGAMLVPLPTFVLDLLIALNIAASVSLLLISVYVGEGLRIATFPTLLLVSTLFRLALEVSATRLVLLKADAGEVIHAFGGFVVAGNLVVGAVMFLILTVIQFVVIAKGSERVAEVGARFTLDAMPGKQMSIDAELRSGHIDAAEARRRRALLARESQFFGSMDGAMKFVRGDAVAGMIVVLINIVGGLLIGIVQKGMDVSAAVRTYTLLTIGGGLVAQIPALLISTAAGIIVTRVSSEEADGHLGGEIGRQVLAQPKALAVTATLLVLLAAVPGLPSVPFLVLGVLLGLIAYRILRMERLRPIAHVLDLNSPRSIVEHTAGAIADNRSEAFSPILTPAAVELSLALRDSLLRSGGHERMVAELMPAVRTQLFVETGIPLPAVQLGVNTPGLGNGNYQVRFFEVPVAQGEVLLNGSLFLGSMERLRTLDLAAREAVHPEGMPAAWIAADDLQHAKLHGLPVLAPEEVIVAHLLQLLRRHAHEFLGIQETHWLLDCLERSHPALVREVVPKVVSQVQLTEVLRRLAEEGVSLRNLREILEALAAQGAGQRDPVILAEHARSALRREITYKHAGSSQTLGVFLLDPVIEDTVRESIQRTSSGAHLALEPDLARDIVRAVCAGTKGVPSPVIVTAADIRRHVRSLIAAESPRVAVLSYQDLTPETKLQTIGRISVGEAG